MKIVFISDTHNRLKEIIGDIPPCDVLVHCGDMTGQGYGREIKKFFLDLKELRDLGIVKHFIGIAGNHDTLFEDDPIVARGYVPEWYNYLEDSSIVIEGIKFYGSPHTPTFFDWAFNEDRGLDIKTYWDKIPEDTDVLVTHGPPMGILDWAVRDSIHVGCEELAFRVNQVKPKIHSFGHIHYSYGVHQEDGIPTKFINASNLGERYDYINKPIMIEL